MNKRIKLLTIILTTQLNFSYASSDLVGLPDTIKVVSKIDSNTSESKSKPQLPENTQEDCSLKIGDIADLITAIISIVALIYTGIVDRRSKKQFQKQFVQNE